MDVKGRVHDLLEKRAWILPPGGVYLTDREVGQGAESVVREGILRPDATDAVEA
eukprot:CAMPEP_0119140396 /NCGR_PEP_ID=MMETSP1310-20130426/29154_1 /TAXON_ID=464262 /ORGANISM="Genus nov. species nov., Strain RCC2339" /LENGTH=53 /DNA_ID=CAMNT_0007131751 /DNA_START=171 /DNA_END=328 /DNA_ORIENTATION=+